MIKYLVNTDGYEKKTREELFKDTILKIVASACDMNMDSVVHLMEQIITTRKSK